MISNDDGSPDKHSDEDPLAVARDTVAKVKNCWLITVAADGEANRRTQLGSTITYSNSPEED